MYKLPLVNSQLFLATLAQKHFVSCFIIQIIAAFIYNNKNNIFINKQKIKYVFFKRNTNTVSNSYIFQGPKEEIPLENKSSD